MSKSVNKLVRPTLAQCFEAPDADYLGSFGWMCGYSADGDFLNLASELFTRRTQPQRAHGGSISLALMLDAGNAPLSLLAVPGVAHLPLLKLSEKPFSLLHAKVALLGFRHRDDASDWIVRLIVSTGNWTRETMEESLDLVWSIDVRSDELHALNENTQQRCADIKAARSLLDWLSKRFDTRLLDIRSQSLQSETGIAMQRFDEWIGRCEKGAGECSPRFFDSREHSLLSQLPDKIRLTGIRNSRKWLAMGSGFYEGAAEPGAVPKVLSDILQTLQSAQFLSNEPRVDVFVNVDACQAIALSAAALAKARITVRAAGQPRVLFGEDKERTLHAKFLLGYNCQQNSRFCLDAWLYMGSGNLTQPGFTKAMHPRAGNLEAGVVFAPGRLLWKPDLPLEQVVENVLPVQWDDCVEPGHLQAGGEMPERPDAYVAPPVAWLRWESGEAQTGALVAGNEAGEIEVLNGEGAPCERDGERFLWPASRPRVVSVSWCVDDQKHLAEVPVVDEFGRIAATPLPTLEVTDAWWHLANFPLPPNEEDPSVEEAGAGEWSARQAGHADRGASSYAVRQMMEFIEQVAERQTSVAEYEWTAWCCRLQQTLMLLANSEGVKVFRELELNPLSPLKVPSFRPAFAESKQRPAGETYEALLDSIAQKWGVGDLLAIGAAS